MLSNLDTLAFLENYADSEIDGVVFSNELTQEYFNLMSSSRRRLSFTTTPFMMYTPSFYYSKKSLVKELFNKQLQRLHEYGLIIHWKKRFSDGHNSKLSKNVPKKLKIEHIFVAFQIVTVIYLISFIAFILEIISVKCRRMRYVLDYLTY